MAIVAVAFVVLLLAGIPVAVGILIASAIGVVITVTNDEHRSQSGMEHQRIVDAIRRHDPEGAKYSMIAHLNTSRNSMVHSRDNCAAKR